jgi:hypothetical protein
MPITACQRKPAQQRGHQQPDGSQTQDGNAFADQRPSIHDEVYGRLHVCQKNGVIDGDIVGQWQQGRRGRL